MPFPGSVLLAVAAAPDGKVAACGPPGRQSWLCSTIYELSGSKGVAQVADDLASPIRVLFIVLLAVVATWLAHRVVNRFTRRLRSVVGSTPTAGMRAAQRAETIGAVLRYVSTVMIWVIAVITLLGELGIELAPLIAGAGVAGVALGFGAQSVVRDFLSGIFMLLEDQFGVGDVIDVGDATGTVESVNLRVTRLRDVEGTVWYVPNGEIKRVGNKSQQWSRALLDVAVASDTDIEAATEVIRRVANDMWQDPEWSKLIIDEPEVWGVEDVGVDRVVIRLVVKTKPLEQWRVARELRARIKVAFDEVGIEMPYTTQRITYQASGDPPAPVADRGEDGADKGRQ
jgi:small conductance mechanosensitive channel